MSELTLTAQARTVLGKKTKSLRSSGSLPVVLYGHGLSSRSLTVAVAEFQKVYRTAGESTLIDLIVQDEKPVKVIVQDVQRHPISGKILHVDFHQVRMTEKLHTEIELAFTGDAPAVKELGGILVKNISRVKVEVLPVDLVSEIPVDVSKLKTFDDSIHVRDLVLPKGITVLDGADEVVVLVTPPRSEEELAELEKTTDEKAAVEAVEGIKKEEQTEEQVAEEGQPSDQGEKKTEDKKEEKKG
ncbi:MAG: 50S ribosomal protein L25 [Candidatus Kerfeldbacteria bacterium]